MKGFRYYLTRPYVIVKERVVLSRNAVATTLMEVRDGEGKDANKVWGLVAPEVPQRNKGPQFFDLDGRPQPKWRLQTAAEKANPGEVLLRPAAIIAAKGPPPPIQAGAKPQAPRVGAAGDVAVGTATPDKFQVVMLPDFEEQYTIRNCNFLAKTQYNLAFGDDSTLAEMGGAYDATTVPIAILKSLQNAITAAGEIREQRITKLGGGPGGAALDLPLNLNKLYFICQEAYIEPGIYRLQKSWERQTAEALAGGLTPERAPGLLTELGFPIGHCLTVVSGADYQTKFQPK